MKTVEQVVEQIKDATDQERVYIIRKYCEELLQEIEVNSNYYMNVVSGSKEIEENVVITNERSWNKLKNML